MKKSAFNKKEEFDINKFIFWIRDVQGIKRIIPTKIGDCKDVVIEWENGSVDYTLIELKDRNFASDNSLAVEGLILEETKYENILKSLNKARSKGYKANAFYVNFMTDLKVSVFDLEKAKKYRTTSLMLPKTTLANSELVEKRVKKIPIGKTDLWSFLDMQKLN